MKKFKFQLEALLKVTRMKKDQAEIAFSKAARQLNEEEQKLRRMEEETAESLRYYYQRTARTSVVELLSFSDYFQGMQERQSAQKNTIAQAAKERDICLDALQASMRKLKSTEQLKAKRLAQFKENLLAEEQKALDEIGLQLYVRQGR